MAVEKSVNLRRWDDVRHLPNKCERHAKPNLRHARPPARLAQGDLLASVTESADATASGIDSAAAAQTSTHLPSAPTRRRRLIRRKPSNLSAGLTFICTPPRCMP